METRKKYLLGKNLEQTTRHWGGRITVKQFAQKVLVEIIAEKFNPGFKILQKHN